MSGDDDVIAGLVVLTVIVLVLALIPIAIVQDDKKKSVTSQSLPEEMVVMYCTKEGAIMSCSMEPPK